MGTHGLEVPQVWGTPEVRHPEVRYPEAGVPLRWDTLRWASMVWKYSLRWSTLVCGTSEEGAPLR